MSGPVQRGEPPAFSGAVLTGGRSARMGTDKALLTVGGEALANRVARVLREAGAAEVFAVGGDPHRLAPLGLRVLPDAGAGQEAGPAAGVLGALEAARCDVVVVAACDLPSLDVAVVGGLLAALGDGADAAVPVVAGRTQQHLLALRRSARGTVADRFADGVRSLHALVEALSTVRCVIEDGEALRDVDRPEDLRRHGQPR